MLTPPLPIDLESAPLDDTPVGPEAGGVSASEGSDLGSVARALRVLASSLEVLIEDARPEVARRARHHLHEVKLMIAAMRSDGVPP